MRVPGDKSISHRAALIAPLASSASVVRGLSDGVDVRASVRAMQRLGAAVECTEEGRGLTIRCAGGGLDPGSAPRLDCGNSGTTARLLAGILAGSGIAAVLDGDPSLRGRPMRRVIYPLQAMGARIEYEGEPDRLPVRLRGRATGTLRALRHRGRVASAQVKSAVLLAGVLARVRVEVSEPALSRDHTERMLAGMGVPLAFDRERMGAGEVRFDPSGWDGGLDGLLMTVPGDPSSAAFLIGASLLAGRAVRVEAVAANPGRIGFLSVLEEMGARIDRDPASAQVGEPLETWTIRPPDSLRSFSIGGDLIPRVIDEIPLLAVLAARARGRSEIRDAAELRVKESDRLAVLARTLGKLGVVVEERPDGLTIQGRAGRLRGDVETRGDHRIAMAFGVLDAAGDADLRIDDRACADISYPDFWEALEPFRHGRRSSRRGHPSRAGRVIAVDGPAASGKSSTALSVARRLGFVHVNSGLLYRAITWWALDRGIAEDGPSLEAAVPGLEIDLVPAGGGFDVSVEGARPGSGLESPAVTARVSAVSTLPAVREVVLERLRRAGGQHEIVCDGRDIGTAVFPDAELKIFLVAEAGERARRRLRQRAAPFTDDDVERQTRRLEARDRLDRSRPLSPLRRAPDAIEIDTTSMPPDEVVDAILELAVSAFR
ncbi:MAG: 3-phosphoshikimate 1-carboxyvinyltransferase [Gemmatimonadetes bacterium]|nr:3-phosphoshikimate 1-carboxyvinyltransferase [Candidatus Palauibacter rhopaloidicola]